MAAAAKHPAQVGALLPDSEITVLVVTDSPEYPCWPAYHDGEKWRAADGVPLSGAVQGWMDLDDAAAVLCRHINGEAVEGEASTHAH